MTRLDKDKGLTISLCLAETSVISSIEIHYKAVVIIYKDPWPELVRFPA